MTAKSNLSTYNTCVQPTAYIHYIAYTKTVYLLSSKNTYPDNHYNHLQWRPCSGSDSRSHISSKCHHFSCSLQL